MKQFTIVIGLLIAFSQGIFAQTPVQTIRGQVIENETQNAIAGATLMIQDSSFTGGAISDTEGYFRLDKVPVGRHELIVRFSGFESTRFAVNLTSGKEQVLTVEMREVITEIKEVSIVGTTEKDRPLNEMATVSARTFSTEETGRYAAAIFDPARMAQNFAGVVSSGDDMTNDIVIRGNSPRGMLWRLEGIEIPNPNHFGDMGSSGGPISMLSSSTLGNSDFYTGAFPSEFGNATSGVFDLNFRRGNNEKRESSLMIGGLGIEASTEGPLSKNSRASYLVNYRYSTLALMGRFIPSLGDVLPTYQDLSFNVYLPTKNMGTFTVFGIGGANKAVEAAVADSTEWEYRGDRFSFFSKQKIGVAGVRHKLLLDNKSYISTTVAATADTYEDASDFMMPEQNYFRDTFDVTNFENTALRLHSQYNRKFSPRFSIKAGILANQLSYNYLYDSKDLDTDVWTRYLDSKGSMRQFGGYFQAKYRASEKLSLLGGFHGTYIDLNGDYAIDPRMAVEYQINPKHKVSLAAGLHSKPEHVSTYLMEIKNIGEGSSRPNIDLPMARSFHLVGGYDFKPFPQVRVKTEVYYQYQFGIPQSRDTNSQWSILNAQSIWGLIDEGDLQGNGTGRNIGIDLTVEKFFSSDYYLMLTGSLFDSRYTAPDGKEYNGRFNSNYNLNLVGGKEFKVGRNKKNVLGFNAKLIWSGGNRYTPIDLEASRLAGERVFMPGQTFAARVPDYFRPDFGVSYTINAKKLTHTIRLDIQNLANRQNVYTQYFDSDLNSLEYAYQNGMFPIFNYRLEF